ncbi:MAG: DUF3078 domain-containing protein, partial [Bacteroidota bacterium]|nr:DUF3078 domain-containing protein [Bacteroidota bacterium]
MKLTESEDNNSLLNFIRSYNIDSFMVRPRLPYLVDEGEELDYLYPYPLFLPLVFNSSRPAYRLSRKTDTPTASLLRSALVDNFINNCQSELYVTTFTNRFLTKIESEHINLVKYDQKDMPEPDKLTFFLSQNKPALLDKPDPKMEKRQFGDANNLPHTWYNPWSTKGNGKLQFSETFISPNWSKGGESNTAGLATLYLEANYNDLNNVQFDNNIEVKVGLNTVSTDSLRNLNVSTDQVRATSKLGIKMHNNWYYSLSAEFQTQLLNNYKKNTMSLQSSLLSPAKLYVSLGMDFKQSKNKYNLSVQLSPASYKLNYLYDNVNLSPSSYGIDAGHHFGSEIGSKVSSVLNWKVSDQINLKSNYYYFTDYASVDTEWENTVDFDLGHN